jgi:hypothetical protein
VASVREVSVRTLATIIIALSCLSCAASNKIQSPWKDADLPPALRSMIHTRADEVPPYGHDDPTLLDPHQWPRSVALAGKKGSLLIHVVTGKGPNPVVETLADVPARTGFYLVYIAPWRAGTIPLGPSYHWNVCGRLYMRAWWESDTITSRTTNHATYPSGKLFEYSADSMNWSTSAGMWLSEFFDNKGHLIGVRYEIIQGDEGRTEERGWWWRGKAVSKDVWLNAMWDLREKVADAESRRCR